MITFEQKRDFLKQLQANKLIEDLQAGVVKVAEMTQKKGQLVAEREQLKDDLEFWHSKIYLDTYESVMPDGKKPTVADRDAWTTVKLRETKEYMAVHGRAAFITAQLAQADSDLAREEHKFVALKYIIGLRTAQIQFLSGQEEEPKAQ